VRFKLSTHSAGNKELRTLAARGVEIFSCGLCLDYFNRTDQLKVGTVTNMFATVESLMQTDSVIRI